MVGLGTGIVPLPDPPHPHYPGYTLPPTPPRHPCPHRPYPRLKDAVGLRSVAQLTLSAQISGSRGMTEVYNLSIAGITNNHLSIPGNK